MDRSVGQTAAEKLRAVSESDLADVIYRFGEDRHARRIARLFVSTRDQEDVETTGQFAEVVREQSRAEATSESIPPPEPFRPYAYG